MIDGCIISISIIKFLEILKFESKGKIVQLLLLYKHYFFLPSKGCKESAWSAHFDAKFNTRPLKNFIAAALQQIFLMQCDIFTLIPYFVRLEEKYHIWY